MLDGVFNPPQKRSDGGDFDSDDEDEGTVDNNSESQTIVAPPEANKEDPRVDNNTLDSPQMNDDGSQSTLVQSQISVVSPSASNITTTFGSENRTVHNLIRRKSMQSRNVSIDSSTMTIVNDSANRPSKIRIEARIDSDKKDPPSVNNSERTSAGARRTLRYNKLDETNSRAKEPEIIEMILTSPSKVSQQIVNAPITETSSATSISPREQGTVLTNAQNPGNDQHLVTTTKSTANSCAQLDATLQNIGKNDNELSGSEPVSTVKSVTRSRRAVRRNKEQPEHGSLLVPSGEEVSYI